MILRDTMNWWEANKSTISALGMIRRTPDNLTEKMIWLLTARNVVHLHRTKERAHCSQLNELWQVRFCGGSYSAPQNRWPTKDTILCRKQLQLHKTVDGRKNEIWDSWLDQRSMNYSQMHWMCILRAQQIFRAKMRSAFEIQDHKCKNRVMIMDHEFGRDGSDK